MSEDKNVDTRKDGEQAEKKPVLQSAEELRKPAKKRGGNRGRIVLIGFCLLVVLAGAVWGLTYLTKTVIQNLNTFKNVWLTNRDVEDVRSIAIQTHDGIELNIEKEGDTYVVPQIAPQVLSQSSCNTAFINAAEFLTEDVAAENVTDVSGFGLETPASRVQIVFSDGETFKLEIGDRAPTSPYYYVREEGSSTVYLLKAILVDIYAGGISAFWDTSALNVSTEGLGALHLSYKGEEVFSLTYASKPTGFRFSQWQMSLPFLSDIYSDSMQTLLASLSELKVNSYVDTAQDLAPYGLDAPTYALSMGYLDGSNLEVFFGDSLGDGSTYLRFGGTNDVYLAPSSSLGFLNYFAPSFLITDFSNIHSIATLDTLTVELDGNTSVYTVDRSGDIPVYKKNGNTMDGSAFEEAFQMINTIQWADTAYDKEISEDTEVALRLIYTFTNSDETAVVEYLDYSISNYALRKNGSIGISIRKDDAKDMLDAFRALGN